MGIKENIFKQLCVHYCNCMSGWLPLPARLLAKDNNCTLYMARKCLKQLKDEGLVISDIWHEYNEYSCRNILLRGFTITDKAKETEIFKQADMEERKMLKEIYGYDFGSFS